jgi:hypothetical protein
MRHNRTHRSCTFTLLFSSIADAAASTCHCALHLSHRPSIRAHAPGTVLQHLYVTETLQIHCFYVSV